MTIKQRNKADQHIIEYFQKHIISYDSNSVCYLEREFRNVYLDFEKYCISVQLELFDCDEYLCYNINRLLSAAIFRNESLDIKVDAVMVKISSTKKSKRHHTQFYSYRNESITNISK